MQENGTVKHKWRGLETALHLLGSSISLQVDRCIDKLLVSFVFHDNCLVLSKNIHLSFVAVTRIHRIPQKQFLTRVPKVT